MAKHIRKIKKTLRWIKGIPSVKGMLTMDKCKPGVFCIGPNEDHPSYLIQIEQVVHKTPKEDFSPFDSPAVRDFHVKVKYLTIATKDKHMQNGGDFHVSKENPGVGLFVVSKMEAFKYMITEKMEKRNKEYPIIPWEYAK